MSTISKSDYDALRAKLEFAPNPWLNALTVAMNMGMFSLTFWLLAHGGNAQYVIAQLLLPIACFQAFSILHDCGHGSFSRNRALTTMVGHYASIFCFMPYFPWKYVHTQHHVWAGNMDHDPGLKLVKRARDEARVPAILSVGWRSWIPIGGAMQHVVYWLHPVLALRGGELSGERLWKCAASVCLLPASYITAHLLWPTLLSFANLAPGLLLYLVLVELVNLPHHLGLTSFSEKLPLWQQHYATRSCDYPPLVSEIVVLNFNFHIEHHLFPTLPWYRLRGARALIKPALGDAYRETTGLRWHLANRSRRILDVMTERTDA